MKLQNNYTTPEQSKRLLELGVQAESADCYYETYYVGSENPILAYQQRPRIITDGDIINFSAKNKRGDNYVYPCWSVGRLIEVAAHIYTKEEFKHLTDIWKERMSDTMNLSEFPSMIDDVIDVFFEPHRGIDFSKLED